MKVTVDEDVAADTVMCLSCALKCSRSPMTVTPWPILPRYPRV